MTECSNERTQLSQSIANFLDFSPSHFHAHVVVASCVLAMHETVAPTSATPVPLIPVGGAIAVVSAEILDEQFLDSRGELLHANITDVNHEVVIVVVCCLRVEMLDVRAIARRNA